MANVDTNAITEQIKENWRVGRQRSLNWIRSCRLHLDTGLVLGINSAVHTYMLLYQDGTVANKDVLTDGLESFVKNIVLADENCNRMKGCIVYLTE